MERKFYTDNFEQLLKDKADEFRMYPSKRVWHSIYNDLHPGRKWPSVAVSLALMIVLLVVGYWNNKSADTSFAGLSSQKNTALLNNRPATSGIFQFPFYGAVPGDQTTVQQPGLTSNNTGVFPSSSLALLTNPGSRNSLLQPGLKNNGTPAGNPVAFENIAIANIGLNIPDRSIVPGTVPSENRLNTADAAVKINSLKDDAVATAFIKATMNSKNKETGYTINTDAVKLYNKTELVNGNNNAATITAEKEGENTTTAALSDENEKSVVDNKKETEKPVSTVAKNTISTEDKAWIEDYAFHNKSKRKKWQDRTSLELYITPGVGYRQLSNDPKYNMPSSTPSFTTGAGIDANKAVNQKPGLGLEAGFVLNYAIAKNLRIKAGVQANYTSYRINADETNHPVLTTLMLIDPNSGYPYMHSASSTLVNGGGAQPVKIHNKTYQVSIPLGFALKLSGNNKLEWYAGATIQPTFVMGGKAYLISADRRNYVADASLLRKWNLNTAFETYINYKFDGFTLQAGPQFRYQLLSTYYKKYTVNENLYNIGIKLGILKNF